MMDIFDHWLSHFETVSVINQCSDMGKLLWMHVCMKGKSHVAYAHETGEYHQAVREALRECFELSCKAELYRIDFHNHEKRVEESWADFADDLLTVVCKEFLSLDEKSLEQIALDKYTNKLHDSNNIFHLK